jgi:hypothetical protein
MKIKFEIGEDYIRIEEGQPIERPVGISRSRWLAFWKHVSVRGGNWLRDAERFLRGEKEGE